MSNISIMYIWVSKIQEFKNLNIFKIDKWRGECKTILILHVRPQFVETFFIVRRAQALIQR